MISYLMLIVKNAPCSILLGYDFIEHFQFIINIKHNFIFSQTFGKLELQNPKLNFVNKLPFTENEENLDSKDKNSPDQTENFKYVRLLKTTKLPPRSETKVLIQPINSESEKLALRRTEIYNKNRILVPNMVINNQTKCIILINPTNEKKSLCRNTRIAKLETYDGSLFTPELDDEVFEKVISKPFNINPKISKEDQAQLTTILEEYEDIFQLDGRKLGRTKRFKFNVDTSTSRPLRRRQYPHPEKVHDEIKDHIDDLLNRGIIEPSQSPWASPCFLVPKKGGNGKLAAKRLVIDYRGLHLITKKNSYPLPRIDDIINRLRSSKYFTTLDLASGFYQIEMEEESIKKTAFISREGLYKFNVLPFGLCNAPPAFCRLIDMVLTGLKYDTCMAYVDDIVVFSETIDDHIQKLKAVFQQL